MIGRTTGKKSGMMTTPEEQSSEWHDDEGSYLVCGVAGSNPNPKQQNNEKVKVMFDCGSQSTACGVNFAKDRTVGHPGLES